MRKRFVPLFKRNGLQISFCILKSSMERRMPYYEGNETYILAAILDPRFKLQWCSNNSERKESAEILKEAA